MANNPMSAIDSLGTTMCQVSPEGDLYCEGLMVVLILGKAAGRFNDLDD